MFEEQVAVDIDPELWELPRSKKEAQEIGSDFYFTGRLCKNGHYDKRRTNGGTCITCQKEYVRRYHKGKAEAIKEYKKRYAREYRKKNAEAIREQRKGYRKENAEAIRERMNKYREKNAESLKEYIKEYRKENAEAIREQVREYRKENPHKDRAKNAKRRAAKLQRTFSGYDNAIQGIYTECQRVSEETGIEHHVDHIIPLQGTTVSGLHVPWNLQIITAEENLAKSNTF